MNAIIETLSSNAVIRDSNADKVIVGGIGTIEGKIWMVFKNRRVFKKSIITNDNNTPVGQPIAAINNEERGPTGHHDIVVSDTASVELMYCHKTVCKVGAGGNVCLFGRTYLMNSDFDDDNDSGEEDSDKYELKNGEHLRINSGIVKVRVCSGGHQVFISNTNPFIRCDKVLVNMS